MKGLFIPEITVEMFRNGCLESIETLMTEGEVYDIEYDPKSEEPERKKGKWIANGDIHKECPFCGEDWDKYVFGEVWYTDELPKFCPNCGADMREGEEE